MRWCLAILVLTGALAGCGDPAASPKPAQAVKPADAPAAPERAVYEELRAGAIQLGAVTQSISEALASARELAARERGDRRQALSDAAAYLDSAGATLADHAVEPPEYDAFAKDFAAQDERRLQAIEAANDARVDAQSAQHTLGDLGGDATSLADRVAAIVADIEEAIITLGGEVEARESASNDAHRIGADRV